jgi:stress response protein YsnF
MGRSDAADMIWRNVLSMALAARFDNGPSAYDTSGPTTDTPMTRSEVHLRAGTETQDVGRARLRKHVVTEHEQVTVPLSHEEVRIRHHGG